MRVLDRSHCLDTGHGGHRAGRIHMGPRRGTDAGGVPNQAQLLPVGGRFAVVQGHLRRHRLLHRGRTGGVGRVVHDRSMTAGVGMPRAAIGALCVPILLVGVIGACGPEYPVFTSEAPGLPEAVFREVGAITLEENAEVINVYPNVTVEDDGSFLIADAREARLRKYGPSGDLVYQVGRRGEGPGEFGLPLAVSRIPDTGHLQVLEISGSLLEFDSSGTQYIRTTGPTLTPAYEAEPLGENHTLFAGILAGDRDPRRLLHIWDTAEQTVLHSFFPTPGDSLTRLASRNLGVSDFDMQGDTIVVVASFTDTLFVFGLEGQELDRVPLPIQGFPRIRSFEVQGGPMELQEWLEKLLLLVDVHWLNDRSLLVQYQRPRGADNEWNLLRTDLRGNLIFDLKNTPRLLAVAGDLLYFVDPHALAPNQWFIAELRR